MNEGPYLQLPCELLVTFTWRLLTFVERPELVARRWMWRWQLLVRLGNSSSA